MGFENAFNKFAKFGNTLNREANKIIGKEVFGSQGAGIGIVHETDRESSGAKTGRD